MDNVAIKYGWRHSSIANYNKSILRKTNAMVLAKNDIPLYKNVGESST